MIGARVEERMRAAGLSQSELARRVGMSQQAVHKLIRGTSRSTASLHRFARELGTTPAYLAGETDDPTADAPEIPELSADDRDLIAAVRRSDPTQRAALLTLARAISVEPQLPSAPALARMFEGLLRAMPPTADLDEQAQLLAKWLPIGLSQLRDLLPAAPTNSAGAEPNARKELAEALATPDRAPQ